MALVLGRGPFAKQVSSIQPRMYSTQARAESTPKPALASAREIAQTSSSKLSIIYCIIMSRSGLGTSFECVEYGCGPSFMLHRIRSSPYDLCHPDLHMCDQTRPRSSYRLIHMLATTTPEDLAEKSRQVAAIPLHNQRSSSPSEAVPRPVGCDDGMEVHLLAFTSYTILPNVTT
jgi:hypothetical protein